MEAETSAAPTPEDATALTTVTSDGALAERLAETWAAGVAAERALDEQLEAEMAAQAERARKLVEEQLLESRGITAEPDVTVVPLGESAAPGAEDEAIVVVASDGVWCAVENDAAAALVGALREEGASAEEAARQLCERAAANGSTDNLSCVVMYA